MQDNIDSITDGVQGLSAGEIEILTEFTRIVREKERECTTLFRITDEQLGEIQKGRLIVDHVVFQSERGKRAIIRSAKVIGITVMVILLFLCLFLPGFADGLRENIITLVVRSNSNRLYTVNYDRYHDDFIGCVLPDRLPEGFSLTNYSRSDSSNMLYVLYTSDDEYEMTYFYYPNGTEGSYDNERTAYYEPPSSFGSITVGHTDDGITVLFFIYGDAYIHIEFNFEIGDDRLVEIVESVRRIS